jgi:hypothetical protein
MSKLKVRVSNLRRPPTRQRILTISVLFLLLTPEIGNSEKSNPESVESRVVEEWISSVLYGDMNKSIASAASLLRDHSDFPIPRKYLRLAERAGINKSFFSSSFNFWDYHLWRSAHFFKNLPDTSNIKKIFSMVRMRIKSREANHPRAPWPYWIWKRGYGVCDRQSWVFCEIAYQLGWETQIIYLRNPETGISPHTICEIRREGQAWLADPLHGILINKSFVNVLDSRIDLWPEYPSLGNALSSCISWTPSFPQEYCSRNQRLHHVLKRRLGDRCPRFGVPPEDRLACYKTLIRKTEGKAPPYPMELWIYPFRLLKMDIVRYARQFGVAFLR